MAGPELSCRGQRTACCGRSGSWSPMNCWVLIVFAAWFALLLVSAASYFPSDQHYAAAAVLLLGPGLKSVQLQRDAARRDSTLLLNALIMRGAEIERSLLCFVAYNDSP